MRETDIPACICFEWLVSYKYIYTTGRTEFYYLFISENQKQITPVAPIAYVQDRTGSTLLNKIIWRMWITRFPLSVEAAISFISPMSMRSEMNKKHERKKTSEGLQKAGQSSATREK